MIATACRCSEMYTFCCQQTFEKCLPLSKAVMLYKESDWCNKWVSYYVVFMSWRNLISRPTISKNTPRGCVDKSSNWFVVSLSLSSNTSVLFILRNLVNLVPFSDSNFLNYWLPLFCLHVRTCRSWVISTRLSTTCVACRKMRDTHSAAPQTVSTLS